MKANQLKEQLESLKPNEAHKERLFRGILRASESDAARRRKSRPRRPLRSAVMTAAAMICMITTTAYAAAYMGLDVKWLNFLRPADGGQAGYLENGAYVVNQQAANENGTLDVKQIIGDSHLIYVLMDFTAPEGVRLSAERYRFDTQLNFDAPGSHGAGIGYEVLDDGRPYDNKISLALSYQLSRQAPIGSPVTLQVRDLEEAAALPDEFETIAPGFWETKFILDYKNLSTTHSVQRKVSLYGHPATLSSISISPIAVTLKVDSPQLRQINEAANLKQKETALNPYTDEYPITIHYRDGTSKTTSVWKGTIVGDFLTDTLTIIKPFTPILNDKEIEAVSFFDAYIPLD
ncbi:hypothetical protein [Paenibacillus methanolicus]|uniref:DUF4179 domain-containing protein n=1 Tax=Paenibacillus methanolicus TaxID=582686 RepID=A0A5S5C7X1_9BACL|nr:hypothetical protein [Paenibacillus methanolicus]TYP74582.1 hypothetical protein BCM02_105126 [Paenibacillus methanolicus]